jgi:hypothetical protein
MRFEELVNQLSSGWKYHVANTDGIKDSWKHFEKYVSGIFLKQFVLDKRILVHKFKLNSTLIGISKASVLIQAVS